MKPKNYFIVDFDNHKLYLKYNDEQHLFDLTEGDVGDFWDSFTDKYGTTRDVNFFIPEDNIICLTIYELYKDDVSGAMLINFKEYEDIEMLRADGDIENYLLD